MHVNVMQNDHTQSINNDMRSNAQTVAILWRVSQCGTV